MQTETGDSFEDSCPGESGGRSEQCRHFEPSFGGTLFGNEAEYSDTDYVLSMLVEQFGKVALVLIFRVVHQNLQILL